MLGFPDLGSLLLALAYKATLAAVLAQDAGRLQFAREPAHQLFKSLVIAGFNLQWQMRSPPFPLDTGETRHNRLISNRQVYTTYDRE